MNKLILFALTAACAAHLSAQNNITNKLGAGGEFRVVKSDNSTQVFTVQEANGFVQGQRMGFTPEGGLVMKMTNRTGASSVKGTIVVSDTSADNGFMTAPASSDFPFGVVYENGVANGSDCWVVVAGVADVLMKASTAATRAYVTKVSTEAGRAVTESSPGSNHDKEIGHSLESKAGGPNVLIKAVLHFR